MQMPVTSVPLTAQRPTIVASEEPHVRGAVGPRVRRIPMTCALTPRDFHRLLVHHLVMQRVATEGLTWASSVMKVMLTIMMAVMHCANLRFVKATDAIKDTGFTSTVWSDECHNFLFSYIKADIRQGFNSTER